MSTNKGFTIIELMVVVAIISIMSAVAIPNIIDWLPEYRLKSAARALYTDMHLAKMTAVNQNTDCIVDFTSDTSYKLYTSNGTIKTVTYSDYKSGVGYGHGNSTKKATSTVTSWESGEDHRSYGGNKLTFNSTGSLTSLGYVYLQHFKGTTSYCVGTPYLTGDIVLRKWNGTDWE